MKQQEKIQQEEEFEEVSEGAYPFPFDPELGPPTDDRVPGLDFRFTHFLGMALVAGAILAISISVNGGLNAGKSKGSRSGVAQPAGESRPDRFRTYELPTVATEVEASKVAPTIRYLNASTTACENANNSLSQLEQMVNELSAQPSLRKDAAWRNRIARPLLAADGAGDDLVKLSDPPVELSAPNFNLHTAGRELRSSVHSFANAIEPGNAAYAAYAAYVQNAVEHLKNSKRMVYQTLDDFEQYRRKVGL